MADAETILAKILNGCYVSPPMRVVDGKWEVANPLMLIIDGSIVLSTEEHAYLESLFVKAGM